MRSGRKGEIREPGAFIMHRREMKESHAWRALPDNARRLLDRLELEHMRHGGTQNGNLACIYDHFEEAGIRRASVALAIRQAVQLGFLQVTRAGYRTAAEFRAPNLYRLTYVHGRRQNIDPTDEWERIHSAEDAAAALSQAAVDRRYEGQPKPPKTITLSRNIEGRGISAPSKRSPVGSTARLGSAGL